MEKCEEHKYQEVSTVFNLVQTGYTLIYKRTITFFCEKCLDEVIVTKTDERAKHEDVPDWFRGK